MTKGIMKYGMVKGLKAEEGRGREGKRMEEKTEERKTIKE